MQFETTQKPLVRAGLFRGTFADPRGLWEQFMGIAGPSGLLAQAGVSTVSMFPTDVIAGTLPREQAWLAAGVVLPEGTALPAGITEERLPPGRYVRAMYYGSYEGLGAAWGEFAEWMKGKGYELRDGICYEQYRNSPDQVPEAELRTDLYIPIATART